jgi:DNA repair protein RadC
MPERLYQGRFDLDDPNLSADTPQDVTPARFAGLAWPERPPVARVELGRFMREAANPVQVNSPAIAAAYLMEHVFYPFEAFVQEELHTLLLNSRNWITHTAMIYRGTVSMVFVRGAEVFRPAIMVNATAVIVAHCHPSGDPEPSPEDVRVTKELVKLGNLHEIKVLDHIIVGNGRWTSLKETELGFEG